MRILLCLLVINISIAKAQQFSGRVIAAKLSNPWTIICGPDNYLWITEGNNYQISRINPADGNKTVLADLSAKRQPGKDWPQNGLMGMALHPQLLNGSPYVYVSYISKKVSDCAPNYGGCIFRAAVVRYRYNVQSQQLDSPTVICDTIPASNDHNGGRLLIAPVAGKDYLFYSVGDMGAGQFNNAGRPNHAQQLSSYEGKVLRFNIMPDKDDNWIPDDNPFTKSAVWSIGHRNPQGLAYAMGHIYSSEHGPYSDDEINIIERGKNYGHPLVIGYADGNYNGLAAGVSEHESLPGIWHSSYPFIQDEKENVKRIGPDNYRDPLITFYPTSGSILQHLYKQIQEGKDVQWPSEAPANIAVYTSDKIPGWKNSLLIPTLKGGKLIRLKLDEKGEKISGDTVNYFKGQQRYRGIAIAPSGDKIYLSVDSTNNTSGPSKENPQKIKCSGCIIEFSYKAAPKD